MNWIKLVISLRLNDILKKRPSIRKLKITQGQPTITKDKGTKLSAFLIINPFLQLEFLYREYSFVVSKMKTEAESFIIAVDIR